MYIKFIFTTQKNLHSRKISKYHRHNEFEYKLDYSNRFSSRRLYSKVIAIKLSKSFLKNISAILQNFSISNFRIFEFRIFQNSYLRTQKSKKVLIYVVLWPFKYQVSKRAKIQTHLKSLSFILTTNNSKPKVLFRIFSV